MNDAAARLRRVRELFDAAIELSPIERTALLARLGADDMPLRRDVEDLLATADTPSPLLEPPLRSSAGSAAPSAGTRIGAYIVTRIIGVGGMGTVYEAVRADDQYRQRVAIKVVQAGIVSELTLARFRRERQILASLQHPNIATLLDGGVTGDGRPFLVMEYIDGQPITAWSNDRNATVEHRLELVRQVCAAVRHAHQNLVIHRDLKPGNILVTADGAVKLLDFGIAKLVGGEYLETDLPLTRGDAHTYTPEYASPEQVRGDQLSTSTDIYSLGVILFELLSGRRPFAESDRARLAAVPPLPSAVVDDAAAGLHGVRSASQLRRRLAGELDSIVGMALRPEPPRRYPSVEALDADLRRHQEGLPVQAQRDWLGYRFVKFAQRNAVAVGAAAVVAVTLIGGVIATTIQGRRAASERGKEVQVNAFLRQLLSSVQSGAGRRDVLVSQVLDSAARRLDRQLGEQPEVRAELETVIGKSYESLGRYDDAQMHLTRALQLDSTVAGPSSTETVVGIRDLGELYIEQGLLDSAAIELQAALAVANRRAGGPDTVSASLLSALGSLEHGRGHPAAAERYHAQALALRTKLLGPRADGVAQSMNDLAVAYGDQGHLAQAESLTRVSLAVAQANHPEANSLVASFYNSLAGVLDFEGKNAAADSAYRATLDLRRQTLGVEHPDYNQTLFNYSMFIFDQKRYAEAAQYSRQILALRGKTLPESHPAIASALQTLGRSLDQLGDTAGGRRALEESLALRRKFVGVDSWVAASGEMILGDHELLVRNFPRAEGDYLDAERLFVARLGEGHTRTRTARQRLVTLYQAWHKPDKASAVEVRLKQASK